MERSEGYADGWRNRERWRLGSACSGELYCTFGVIQLQVQLLDRCHQPLNFSLVNFAALDLDFPEIGQPLSHLVSLPLLNLGRHVAH